MQAGSVHEQTLKKYNRVVIDLAQRHGGMIGLSRKLGMTYSTLVRWSVGDRVPDFNDSSVISKYRKLERQFVRLSGLTLPEIFCPKSDLQPPTVPLESLNGDEPHGEFSAVVDLAIDFKRAVAKLDEDDRKLLLLAAQGWPQSELGELWGCTRARIGQRLTDIREQVARRMNARRSK